MTNRYWVEQEPSGWYVVFVQTTSPDGHNYPSVGVAHWRDRQAAERFRDRLETWQIVSGEVLVIQSYVTSA